MNNIQWNKVTWYSKLIAGIVFVALPFIGFYYGAQYGKVIGTVDEQSSLVAQDGASTTTAASNSGAALSAYYTTPSEWQVDANNTKGGFSIAYPIDFSVQDSNYSAVPLATGWRNNVSEPGTTYFILAIPRAFEPQTNLGEVTLTVGASSNGTAVTRCLEQINVEPTAATSSEVINGVPFTVFHSSDAGAGNLYETTSYRTVHSGKCYAIEYTIHSNQIANYPVEYNLKQFDEAKIATLMQGIIGTFKFQ